MSRTDVATYAGVAAVPLAIALAACSDPARRATTVDPHVVMRAD